MKLPKLTEKQQKLKAEIEDLERRKMKVQFELTEAKRKCIRLGHVVVPYDLDIDEKLKTDKWASSGAYCLVCRDFGEGFSVKWWCPKSPDHRCHYTGRNEYCDYCGMPDERK